MRPQKYSDTQNYYKYILKINIFLTCNCCLNSMNCKELKCLKKRNQVTVTCCLLCKNITTAILCA